jgi:hypothetical protein
MSELTPYPCVQDSLAAFGHRWFLNQWLPG